MKKPIIADSTLVSKYISGDEKSLEILINRQNRGYIVLFILRCTTEI